MNNGRNIYARMSTEPEGQYEINVADVGDEDWPAALAKDCHVPHPEPALRSRSADPAASSRPSRRSKNSRIS